MSQDTRKVISATQPRQAVLDYLHQYGPLTARQLAEAIGYKKHTLQSYLREMRRDHEIRSEEHFEGRVAVVVHIALVKTTSFVDPQRAGAKQQAAKRDRPGVHRGTERAHPIPNQGGQGAVRQFPGIRSSAEMI